MPNPYGVNQLGSDRVAYGQAKKLKELSGEAPMSGAPLATPALNAPQTVRRQQQPRQQAAPAQSAAPTQPPVLPVSYQAQLAQTWAQVAATPGASDLVKQMAQEAQLGS